MVKPKTKISKQKFLSQITKKPRKCDIKKERKLENQRIRKYQQFLDILNLMWSIVDSVSLEDHINLAETMKDDYILLLLRRPSKKNILDDVCVKYRFDNFERKNFKFIEYFNMEIHIVVCTDG